MNSTNKKNVFEHNCSIQNINVTENIYKLKSKSCDFEISDIGGAVNNIVLNNDFFDSEKDSNVNLLRPSTCGNSLYATKSLQVISFDNPNITFGKYNIIEKSDKSVTMELFLSDINLKITKRFYIDDEKITSLGCDVKIDGTYNETLWISSGMLDIFPVSGKSYYKIMARSSDNIDTNYSKTINVNLPADGYLKVKDDGISWVATRSGLYSLILQNISPKLSTDIYVLPFKEKELLTNSSKQEELKIQSSTSNCFIAGTKLGHGLNRFCITASPCSKHVLNSLDINNNNYSSIENVFSFFSFIGNPVLNLMRTIFYQMYSYTKSWKYAFFGLIAVFVALSIPITIISSSYSNAIQEHIAVVHDLERKMKSQMITPEQFARGSLSSLRSSLPGIMLSFLSGMLNVILVISFGIFFRYSFELMGVNLVNNWIPDLSKPDEIMCIHNIPFFSYLSLRILPVISGITLLFRASTNKHVENQDFSKTMNKIMPIVITFMLYDMPSGFHIYFIITGLVSALSGQIMKNRV